MAELRKEVYSKELAGRLFPNNEFFTKAYKENLAMDAIAIKIPQSGSVPGAVIGQPKQLPLPIKSVTDDSLTINVYPIIAPPVLIDNETEITVSYNKRAQYQQQQADTINTAAADIAAVEWGPTTAARIISTTGSARATSVTGLTGTRLAMTVADFVKAKVTLMKQNLGANMGNLYALLTADAYTDIMLLPDFVSYEKLGLTSRLIEGVVGRFMGFDIMVRVNDYGHVGVTYTAANAKNALGVTTAAATDRPANLFWSDKYAAYAHSGVNSDINGGPGLVGGKVIEAWTRFGAGLKRSDQKGIVAVVEPVS